MKIKKLLIILLAFIMLLSVVGCDSQKKPDGPDDTSTSDDLGSSEEIGGKLDEPHETYGGHELNIYAWKGYSTQFVLNDADAYSSMSAQAIWERDQFIEEKLDVELNYIVIDVGQPHETFLNNLEASVMAGDAAFDFVEQYNRNAGAGTMRGLYVDLQTNDEINLEEDYWVPEFTKRMSLGNKMHFAAGDMVTTTTTFTYAMHYNKDLIADRGLETPYDLVQKNQWTWEKVFELTQETYVDLGDAADGYDDSYGIVLCGNNPVDAMYVSAGMTFLGKDADGFYTVSEDFRSEKAATFVQYLSDMFSKDENFIAPTFDWVAYPEGRALFSVDIVGAVGTVAAKGAVKHFGVAPLPKYDDQQSRYYANHANNYILVSIPFDCPNFEAAGAVMEYMAIYGQKYVLPAIFEDGFKLKYSESKEDAEMFDLVRASASFDAGLIYVDRFQNVFAKTVRSKGEWGSISLEVAEATKTALIPILEDLGDLKR